MHDGEFRSRPLLSNQLKLSRELANYTLYMAKSLSVVEFIFWEHMPTTISLLASSPSGVFPGERHIQLRLDHVTRNKLAARNNEA